MPKVKTVTVLILMLLLAFPGGSSNIARRAALAPAGEGRAAEPSPSAGAKPAPAAGPSNAPGPFIKPSPRLACENEAETNGKAKRKADEELPEPVLSLPGIPDGAPAPPQIKSLPGSGMACLTFDDGYSEDSIVKILDCLRASGVRSTFFVIGSCLKRYPDRWRQAASEGHEIAYHTMKHRCLNECSNRKIVADINEWNDTVRSILGPGYVIPKIARAPGGKANARVRRLFWCLGYKLIYWSSDTFTGVYKKSRKNAAESIAHYIVDKTKQGSISLQHFNTYDASSLPLYIEALKEAFTLGTVSEALEACTFEQSRPDIE